MAFELGEAFQFDWSEEGLVVGGIYYRLQVAHMKLCASRPFWLAAYPSQDREMQFDAHTRCFSALGGVARRGIYDNMKTAADRRASTLLTPDLCSQRLFIPGRHVRGDDGIALGIEGHGANWNPVASAT
jgi:transposase